MLVCYIPCTFAVQYNCYRYRVRTHHGTHQTSRYLQRTELQSQCLTSYVPRVKALEGHLLVERYTNAYMIQAYKVPERMYVVM